MVASLPNTLTALCLNSAGLQAFMEAKAFDKMMSVFTDTRFIGTLFTIMSTSAHSTYHESARGTMDLTSGLAKGLDQLMRHQPTLRVPCFNAIVRTLEKCAQYGENPKCVIKKELIKRLPNATGNHNNPNLFIPPDWNKTQFKENEIPLTDYITNTVSARVTYLNSVQNILIQIMLHLFSCGSQWQFCKIPLKTDKSLFDSKACRCC